MKNNKNILNIKNDFPWFKNNKNFVYLDSAATSLKPKNMIDKITNYYSNLCTNPHNTDSVFTYNIFNEAMIETRKKTAKLFNAEFSEIIFTSGATESINLFANGIKKFLKTNDEILLTTHEHASNIVPWLQIKKEMKIKIKFAEFTEKIPTENDIIKFINKKTKILSFANITNLYGYFFDVEKISKAAKKINPNIIIIIDAAQSAPHSLINLKKWNVDFMAVSVHKMLGPTGIGIAYINKKWLNQINPLKFGGSMNNEIFSDDFTYADSPYKFEGGTPNIAGIIGWSATIDYLNNFGWKNIENKMKQLKEYAILKLKNIPNLLFYNKELSSSMILFNIVGVNAQDLASFLGSKNIIVRSGLSCSKMVKSSTNISMYVRASFYVYNDFSDIDKLCDVLKEFRKGDELNHVI